MLLTTQYLEEADHLADSIAVIDTGKVIARGTADELKNQVGGERLEITVEVNQIAEATKLVEQVSGATPTVDAGIRKISAPVSNGSASLIQVLRLLDDAQIHPLDIGLKRPSLDDVFISLTGHVAEVVSEVEAGGKNAAKRK
jgi:ABC-2 type transport system ATP-binding protein